MLRSWAYPRWLRYGVVRLLGAGHELIEYVPWIESELRRSDTMAIVQAGRALGTHDARPWASSLGKPAGSLITTNDHLVLPRKQRQLADALGAYVIDLPADHIAAWEAPAAFSAATLELVDRVTRPPPTVLTGRSVGAGRPW